MRTRWLRLMMVGSVLAGCGSVDASVDPDGSPGAGADAAPGQADAARPDGGPAGDVVLRYDFDGGLVDDGGARYVPDVGGADRRGLVVGAVGGEALLEAVAREDAGMALRFPGECEEVDPVDCPRVILEAEDSADANPGQADFAVSLDFLVPSLPAGSTIADQNVMQKGNFDDPGQWKVEIDVERRPICVFHYPGDGDAPLTVRVQRAVDDGAWHSLRCERRGAAVLAVLDGGDGEDTRTVDIPAGHTLDIANSRTIRVGGQDVTASADQFHGSVDNVSVEIF
jgi:hypothetical protein